jgi:hypothetical protein
MRAQYQNLRNRRDEVHLRSNTEVITINYY